MASAMPLEGLDGPLRGLDRPLPEPGPPAPVAAADLRRAAAPDELRSVPCAGVPVAACTREQAAATVVGLALSRRPGNPGAAVHLCNAYTLSLADKDPAYREMLRAGDVNLPDGQSVVWATQLRHRGQGLPAERVDGTGLFLDVVALGARVGLRHYLLGSTPEVVAALEARLRELVPDAQVVRAESPPFRELSLPERRDQVRRLRASGADVVWVGLGTPKQDWACAELAAEVPAVFVAVGAAFEFLAGTRAIAPAWMRRSGLEWTHRLASEPRRLWRRYLFGNARFLRAAVLARD